MKTARSPFPPVPPRMRLRTILSLGLLMAWLVVMIGRVFYLQVVRADTLRERAESQSVRTVEIPAVRGRILDAGGRVLAEDIPAYSVWLAPAETESLDAAATALLQSIAFDVEALKERAARGLRFIPVARKVPLDVAAGLKEQSIRGVHLLPDRKRIYPLGKAAAPLLGFVGFEGKGMDGLEAYFERDLAGRPGRVVLARDGQGRVLNIIRDNQPVVPGRDLHLTIISPIQQSAYDALVSMSEKYKPEAAVCVAVEPETGGILAMASMPSYNPEDTTYVRTDALRNRAVTDVFEPGSSFKPFVMSAALELGVVSLGEKWNCHNGAWRHRGRLLHDAHGYSVLDTAGVVIKSSNIGMAQVGLRVFDNIGYEGFREAVAAFGFGERTGIPTASESPGLLLPHTRWTYYSVTSIPMGQEIAVSPLQLSIGYAALVNGGRLMKPRIVDKVEWRGEVLRRMSPEIRRQAVSEKTSDTMRDILRRVVEEGTGKRAQIAGYSVGGKTGTAQKAENGIYVPGKFIAVFAGFTPVEKPRIMCVVMVEEPKGAHYGGTVAAPVVREVLQSAIAYFGLQPDKPRLAKR